ncbi:MAG TPA: DinB family protein [Vicinamibacterales bacterium]|nr:DinB family protein [Vicinamibacterales bacterium]HOG28523.1 DinB family protein [Vicinamibacterales bacterium]HOQ60406.1 DinB family protein [Vicinamibacterales bacterium]HPK71857.1 DinB family protein [Vicinamibacterales bacterium]HPW21511.1 DinB family protein [Vicinamibacterales bacterium]
MALVDALLAEYDHELAVTRKVLERVDEARLGWQPHERSMSLGRLAKHVAEVPRWARTILDDAEFDLADEADGPAASESLSDLLTAFDGLVLGVRARLAAKTDAELATAWTLKRNGQDLFSMPRSAAWRTLIMNHLIHHRGQLSVYLRLTGSKVPSIYGPSADEA